MNLWGEMDDFWKVVAEPPTTKRWGIALFWWFPVVFLL
jgi:hypothetical protein